MEELLKLKEVYGQLQEQGWPNSGASVKAVKQVFKWKKELPFIHMSKWEKPSHIFYGEYVYFFDTDLIYKAI